MESRGEAERSEEEGEEGGEGEWPMVLELEEEEIAMATSYWRLGFSVLLGFGRKMSLP